MIDNYTRFTCHTYDYWHLYESCWFSNLWIEPSVWVSSSFFHFIMEHVLCPILQTSSSFENKSCKSLSSSNIRSQLVWPVPLAQVLPCLQLILPSKTWFFGNLFEFSETEITLESISLTFWIQILPNKFH